MKSAEEFFESLNKAANPYWFEGDMPGKDALIDMIRARDREIVEDSQKEIGWLVESLKELMSIVKIHSNNTDNNFAWAEMSEAERTLRSLTTASA